jgi:DGQHR domain-containing protein
MKKRYQYACLPFRQNASAPWLCVFHAPASQILEWAAVERLPDQPRAPQRPLSEYKAQSIKRFLDDPRNSIPTSVTLAVRPGNQPLYDAKGKAPWDRAAHGDVAQFILEVEEGTPESDKPAVIIDGQHRLFGMERFDPKSEVTIVALLDADDLEIAFQFLVINNKVTRVPPDHIRALTYEYDKEKLEQRLSSSQIRRTTLTD